MTIREITSHKPGPLTIDLSLLRCGGTVTVRAIRTPDERATITVHTEDETGPAADAVRDADLHATDTRLQAAVQGRSGSGATVITNGRGRVQTVIGSGSVIQVGGDMTIVNGRIVSGGNVTITQGSSMVRVVALVPAGSIVTARTDSADIATHGKLRQVNAQTVSGDITIDTAEGITARTTSGDIHLARTDLANVTTTSGDITIGDFGGTSHVTTVSGDIDVHATTGGDLDVSTTSGDIRVTATEEALTDGLDIRPRTVSGHISVPPRRTNDSGPRRRRN